jgi:glycosyltransferase involved in cell wall biosynthesis
MKNISIIIPTLNEEAYLRGLLEAIRQQTCPPLEVIVADAGSSDQTVAIALQAGCRVVPGGRPACGRNAGAEVALGDILIFLDADVLPKPDFLACALDEFNRRKLDVATCSVQPLGGNLTDAIFHHAANVFIQATQPFKPHAPGFCILSRKQTHVNIGGFDEALYLSEDHDYVRRAVTQGARFGVLRVSISVSVRRLVTDGRLNVAMRYSFLTLNEMLGDAFNQTMLDRYLGEYHFGHHSPVAHFTPGRLNIVWRQIHGATLSPIRHAVDSVQQETYHLIYRYKDGRKSLDNLLHITMPASIRGTGLVANKGVKALTNKVDTLIKQRNK